jgi:hypothetical protein
MKFYNPKLSTITFSTSLNRGTVQIAMAKTINPGFSGRPEKGQKVYDWENTVYFSLQPIECVYILENMNSLLNGTYTNLREKDERFKKCLTLTHFKNNQPSRLLIDRTKDQSGNPTGSILISIIPPRDVGNPVTYAFRHEEMRLVTFYLDHGAKNLSFYKDMYEAVERIIYAKNKKKFSQSQDNHNNYDSSGYGQTTFDEPTTTSNDQAMDSQHVGNVGEIDMGW